MKASTQSSTMAISFHAISVGSLCARRENVSHYSIFSLSYFDWKMVVPLVLVWGMALARMKRELFSCQSSLTHPKNCEQQEWKHDGNVFTWQYFLKGHLKCTFILRCQNLMLQKRFVVRQGLLYSHSTTTQPIVGNNYTTELIECSF